MSDNPSLEIKSLIFKCAAGAATLQDMNSLQHAIMAESRVLQEGSTVRRLAMRRRITRLRTNLHQVSF